MLLKVSIVLLVVAVCASARSQADFEEGEERGAVQGTPSARLFAIQKTITKTVIVTSTVVQTTQSVCASLTNVTGSCRRRRRGAAEDKPIVLSFDEEDDIDIFKPSQVQKIEPTPQADLTHFYSSGDVESSTISDPVELDIIGVNGQCLTGSVAPRFGLQSALNPLFSLFNVTLQFTTTVTASLVVTSTTTSGSKAFVVSGCTPSPFPFKLC